MSKTKKEIENCLYFELRNMISEFELEQLTEESIYNYFRMFMCDAEIDSNITVNVLEQFGELGEEEVRNIKVYEGW